MLRRRAVIAALLSLGVVLLGGAILWTIERNGFPGRLQRGVDQALSTGEGVVRLDTVTPFDWDEVSVIPGHRGEKMFGKICRIGSDKVVMASEDHVATLVFTPQFRAYRMYSGWSLFGLPVHFAFGPCLVPRQRAFFKVEPGYDGRQLLVLVEPPKR